LTALFLSTESGVKSPHSKTSCYSVLLSITFFGHAQGAAGKWKSFLLLTSRASGENILRFYEDY